LPYAWQGWLNFDALAKLVFDTCTAGDGRIIPNVPIRFQVDRLLIEDSAAARPVALELERIYGVSSKFQVELLRTGTQDKVARLQSVEHFFRAGSIYAPNRKFADLVIDQMTMFPMGKHDDLVDSTSQALRWFRDQHYLYTREEEQLNVGQQGRYIPRSARQPLYPA
jgi:hypothetical protein